MAILNKDDLNCYYNSRIQFAAVWLPVRKSQKLRRRNEILPFFQEWLLQFGCNIVRSDIDQMYRLNDWLGVDTRNDVITFESDKHLVMFKLKFSNKN
jgi:hypothetical protein